MTIILYRELCWLRNLCNLCVKFNYGAVADVVLALAWRARDVGSIPTSSTIKNYFKNKFKITVDIKTVLCYNCFSWGYCKETSKIT